jgi:hypothetical protein
MCKAIQNLCENAICLEDFQGSIDFGGCHGEITYWADWCPADKMVYFGGAWGVVPDLPALVQPTLDEVVAHVEAHDGFWYRDRRRYFAVSTTGVHPFETNKEYQR